MDKTEVVKKVHALMSDKNNYTARLQAEEIVEEYAEAKAGPHDTKKWKYFGDCCPRCGDGAEVYTDSDEEGYFFEDDAARCVGCTLTGGVIISESHGAGISWA